MLLNLVILCCSCVFPLVFPNFFCIMSCFYTLSGSVTVLPCNCFKKYFLKNLKNLLILFNERVNERCIPRGLIAYDCQSLVEFCFSFEYRFQIWRTNMDQWEPKQSFFFFLCKMKPLPCFEDLDLNSLTSIHPLFFLCVSVGISV